VRRDAKIRYRRLHRSRGLRQRDWLGGLSGQGGGLAAGASGARPVTAGPGRVEAVVFDLDGTLADTMALVPKAYADAIKRLGGPEVSPGEIVAAWHIGPTPTVLQHFLGRKVTARDVECFYDSFQAVTAAVRPFPGITAMLRSLRRQGYRMAIFTQATRRAATLTIAAAGIGHFRLPLVGGEEAADPKPAPEGLLLACRRIGAAPSAAAYVGDAEADLQCAAAAGSLGVHARWGAASAAVTVPHLAARHPSDVADLLAMHRVAGSPGPGRQH
jgi:HAD superfamily hydrolase (TIGR01549 family)